jgi:hypothetical protein
MQNQSGHFATIVHKLDLRIHDFQEEERFRLRKNRETRLGSELF